MKKIPLIKPYMDQQIKDRVCQVLDSGYLTEGPVTKEFEEAVRNYLGCACALAVTSCTTGLELALRALGIGPGDEVIVPDYTYPATADVAAVVGADIVLVDIDRETMLIDYEALEAAVTPRTRAVLPVSLFGNPLDYDRLLALKAKYGFYLVEDAACALGAEFRGVKVGSQADISVFSFHPRKFITTGEGGLIATNNPGWRDWMDSYKHFGMGAAETRLTTNFVRIGTNYKLSNILAAVGLGQMARIGELLSRRLELAENYRALLKDHPQVGLPRTTPHGRHSYQTFCVFIERRDEVMAELRQAGIEVQIGSYALQMHAPFAPGPHCRAAGDLLNSRYAFEHCLALPLYHDLQPEDQQLVVRELTRRL
jgi:dTDP-4-amino-4,6-dideoxygalactose transaminase